MMPLRRRKPKLSDFVTMYCDHRDTCMRTECPKKSTKTLRASKDDIAYQEPEHCGRYKPEDGGLSGADVVEIGVWK